MSIFRAIGRLRGSRWNKHKWCDRVALLFSTTRKRGGRLVRKASLTITVLDLINMLLVLWARGRMASSRTRKGMVKSAWRGVV